MCWILLACIEKRLQGDQTTSSGSDNKYFLRRRHTVTPKLLAFEVVQQQTGKRVSQIGGNLQGQYNR